MEIDTITNNFINGNILDFCIGVDKFGCFDYFNSIGEYGQIVSKEQYIAMTKKYLFYVQTIHD